MYPTSKDEGPRDIGNNMSMVQDTRKTKFGVNSGCGFTFGSLWHFITKCVKLFITKCDSFIRN